MSTTEEIVSILIDDFVLENVALLFKSSKRKFDFEKFDTTFRLFKTEAGTVNLEVLICHMLDQNDDSVQGENERHVPMYFKPIGFYIRRKKIFSSIIELTILKELEETLFNLVSLGVIIPKIKINKFSLIGNALIAAYSVEAFEYARRYEDKQSLYSNGLFCNIYMCLDGFPQFFLDDRYDIEGPLVAYRINDLNEIRPIIYYKKMADKLAKMHLMNIYRVLY